MRTRHRRPGPALLLLPALLFLLGSCGGGGGGGGDEEPPVEEGFRVVESDPFDEELAVARDAEILLVFSDDLRVGTITSESVKVTESFTGRVVAGRIEVDDFRTVRLTPYTLLALNTEFRILVTTDVENRFGERLTNDFVSHFRTVVTDAGPPPDPPPPPKARLIPVG